MWCHRAGARRRDRMSRGRECDDANSPLGCCAAPTILWPFAVRTGRSGWRIGVLLAASSNLEFRAGRMLAGVAPGADHRPQRAHRDRWADLMPPKFADTQRNWLRSAGRHPGPALRLWGHCCRRPALCRSCRSSAICRRRWTAWRGQRERHRFHEFRIQHQRKMAELLKQIAPNVTRGGPLDPA